MTVCRMPRASSSQALTHAGTVARRARRTHGVGARRAGGGASGCREAAGAEATQAPMSCRP